MKPDGFLSRLFVRYARGPEHRGKRRLIRLAANRLLPTEGVIAEAHPGVRLFLHPRDWIEFVLLTTGQYEPVTLRWIEANLAAGDVAVLAGVNFGLHVTVAARRVGPTGLVVGVEPQPAALLRASANLHLNGVAGQVRLVTAAVGDGERLLQMPWPSADNAGAASFLRGDPADLTVPVFPTWQIVRRVTDRSVRLMLLDVEGYEWFALRGLIGAPLPELLVVEMIPALGRAAGVESAQIYALIRDLGYELYDLTGRPVASDADPLVEANLAAVRSGVRVQWPPTGSTASGGAPPR